MLEAKRVELIMVLDGREFRHTVDIPSAHAKEQYYRSQGIGDMVAKTIFYNSDIKEHFNDEVLG